MRDAWYADSAYVHTLTFHSASCWFGDAAVPRHAPGPPALGRRLLACGLPPWLPPWLP